VVIGTGGNGGNGGFGLVIRAAGADGYGGPLQGRSGY
jgi:hypothetical protein